MSKGNNQSFILLLSIGTLFSGISAMENNTTMPIKSPHDRRIIMGTSAPTEGTRRIVRGEVLDEAVSSSPHSGAAAALAGDPTSSVDGYIRLKHPRGI